MQYQPEQPSPEILAKILVERDPSRLFPWTKHPDPAIARAAASRYYGLVEKGES